MSDLVRTKLEDYLKKYDAEDIEQIKLDIREVHFDDGTGWSLGLELRQDPLNPKIWRSVIQGQMKNQMSSSVWMSAFVPIPLFNFLGGYMSYFYNAANQMNMVWSAQNLEKERSNNKTAS
ncbi:MAG: hypothetical protein LC778_08195 [Acidobacteria bacterium]|nr:hypothetical protein [Acidobacteriota bacterium]